MDVEEVRVDERDGLPPDVALLWGLRESPRRGRRPGLTLAEIVAAAVALADREGLAAVSMARVAAALGNSTMALYRYVASKDELLLLMSDAGLEGPPPIPADAPWREQLTAWAHAVLAAIRRHPWYREIPITGPPMGPNNMAWLDRALAALGATDLDESGKFLVVSGLLPIVHGQARLAIDLAAGRGEDPAAFEGEFGRVMTAVADPRRFPALARALSAGVFDDGDPEPPGGSGLDAEFAFSLACYLDGVEAFMAARGHRPGAGTG